MSRPWIFQHANSCRQERFDDGYRGKARVFCAVLLASFVAFSEAGAPGGVEEKPERDEKASKEKRPRLDLYGDPLPEGAIARMGSMRLRHGDALGYVGFSSDGKTLMSSGTDGCVRFWEVATGKLLGSRPGFAWSHDGQTIVTRDEKDRKVVILVDTKTGKERCRFNEHKDIVSNAVVFARNGTVVASASGREELCLWDPCNGRLLHRLVARLSSAWLVTFSPNCKQIAFVAGPRGEEIHVANVATGKVVHRLKGHTGSAGISVFSSDGKMLASTGSDCILRIWDLALGKEVRRIEGKAIRCVAYSADGKTLLTGADDGIIRYFDQETIQENRQFVECPGQRTIFVVSPDGSHLACWSGSNTIRMRELATGKLLCSPSGHDGGVTNLAFCPVGTVLATRANDSAIRLWDAASGKELARLEADLSSMESSLAYSADGKTLVAMGTAGTITVWDTQTRKLRIRFRDPRSRGLDYCALSPDGRLVATAGGDRPISLLHTTDGTEVRRLEGPVGEVSSLAFSPDGKLLAVGSSQFRRSPTGKAESPALVRLWDVESGEEFATFEGHKGHIVGLTFSPDGRTLTASGVFETSHSLYEVASRSRRAQWQIADPPRSPWPSALYRVAFSASGDLLAAGGWDQTVYLWDIRLGKEVWRSPWRDGMVEGLAFHGDQWLATGSGAGTVLMWDVNALLKSRPGSKGDIPVEQLEKLWADLADSDAHRAFAAVRRLWGSPTQAVDLLGSRLRPVLLSEESRRRIAQLILDLDSDTLKTREEASKELFNFGEVSIPALRAAAHETRSPEVRRRSRAVLAKLRRQATEPETVRTVRAVETLEHLGSASAIEVLKRLARGAKGAPQTEEALASLARLQVKQSLK